MAFLTINNITIAVDLKKGDRKWTEVGASGRALDGTLRTSIVARKPQWDVQTRPILQAEAEPLERLVMGFGHRWGFADGYSSKFLAVTKTGTVTFNVAGGKFSVKVQVAASSHANWTPSGDDALTGDYTLTVWRLETAVWHHYVITSTSGVVHKWKDGAQNDGLATAWLTISAGVLQLGDGTNADDFSDLVALPFAVPTTWPAMLAATTIAFSALPALNVSGEWLNSKVIAARGSGASSAPVGVQNSGWQKTAQQLSFVLDAI